MYQLLTAVIRYRGGEKFWAEIRYLQSVIETEFASQGIRDPVDESLRLVLRGNRSSSDRNGYYFTLCILKENENKYQQ